MNSKLTGEGDDEEEVKKSIAFFAYKQRLLSIEMKTKLAKSQNCLTRGGGGSGT